VFMTQRTTHCVSLNPFTAGMSPMMCCITSSCHRPGSLRIPAGGLVSCTTQHYGHRRVWSGRVFFTSSLRAKRGNPAAASAAHVVSIPRPWRFYWIATSLTLLAMTTGWDYSFRFKYLLISLARSIINSLPVSPPSPVIFWAKMTEMVWMCFSMMMRWWALSLS